MDAESQTESSAPVIQREHRAAPNALDVGTESPSLTRTHSPSLTTVPMEPVETRAPAGTEVPEDTAATPAVEEHTVVPNRPNELTLDQRPSKTIYDFQVLDCFHELYDLSQHKGKCVLIVNVASKCKDSTQTGYEMLQTLYRRHCGEGFTILAFPCNEFGNGEPDEADQIAELLSYAYPSLGDIEFPIMAKVEVNGGHELPLYSYLKSCIKGTVGQEAIRWNFSVFLIDKEGYPRYRFPPNPPLAGVEKCLQILLDEDPNAAPATSSPEAVTSPEIIHSPEVTLCEEAALQQTERSAEFNSTTDTIPGVDDSANVDEF